MTATRERAPGDTSAHPVQAVQRTLRLLEELGNAGAAGASLAALARAAGLSEPTAMRYLATLADGDFAERDAVTGRYRLGLGVLVLSERALGDVDPRPIVLPYMEQLRTAYGHTVNLAAFRVNRIVLIEVLEGIRSIRKGARVGEQDSLHSTALGKAILAQLPRERALALLEENGLHPATEHTLTSVEALEEQFRQIHELGYAVDDEEGEIGLRCVGVAILDRRGAPAYGLSISAPANVFGLDTAAQVGPLLVRVGATLSQRLGYQGSTALRQPKPGQA
jgi:IclR family acetate operon transcriptional repressor